MTMWTEIKRRGRDVVGPVLGFCAAGYFIYHSIEGERGLVAYARLSNDVAQAKLQFEEANAERKALERRVNLLRSDHLDADMLEERARLMLNLVRPDEIVILDQPSEPR